MDNPQTDRHLWPTRVFKHTEFMLPHQNEGQPISDLVTTICTVELGNQYCNCNGIHTYFMGKHHTMKTLQW